MPRIAKKIIEGKVQCSGCQAWLPLSDFHRHLRSVTGTQSHCKRCARNRRCPEGTVNRRNRPHLGGKQKCVLCGKWKNPDEFEIDVRCNNLHGSRCKPCLSAQNTSRRESSLDDYLRYLVSANRSGLRKRPKAKRLSWPESCVTFDFLKSLWTLQAGKCALTGIPMVFAIGTQKSASIDRKDSQVGYIPENVQLVCKTANLMKGTLSQQDFEFWCMAVIEHSREAMGVSR